MNQINLHCVLVELDSRQCNQIHQKREEKADKIQEVSRENQQLRVEIHSLNDVCSQETKKAQVWLQAKSRHFQHVCIWLGSVVLFLFQVMYDTLSTAMDELDRRIEMKILNVKEDAIKMLATFQ